MDVVEWQKRSDAARLKDQEALHNRLNKLESQLKELFSMSFRLLHPQLQYNVVLLGAQDHSTEAMIVSFTRYLEEHSGGNREQEFFSRCIRYLSVKGGRRVRRESWMITSFDVELGREIGSGGL